MANDRIYLKCKKCGMNQMLYKVWASPDESYLGDADKIEAFIGTHIYDCQGRCYGGTLQGDPGFVLESE